MFRQNDCERDTRKAPDNRRRGQFQAGWKDALSHKEYSAESLKALTWRNLGYRFGKCFALVEEADYVYEVMTAKYKGA